jgi:MoxR-like ATPase
LPEAQLDRFMFEIIIDYLSAEDELDVVRQTTSLRDIAFEYAMSGEEIRAFQQLVRKVPVSKPVSQYALNLVRCSRPGGDALDFVRDWVDYGASTRAAQYLVLGGKARALINGRYHVDFDDIVQLAKPVLRHRVLRNFHAESEKITSDDLIERLLDAVPLPSSGM